MAESENLRAQSARIKKKVNAEVEAVFDSFMKISSRKVKQREELNTKIHELKGLIDRIDVLKKVKDAICE